MINFCILSGRVCNEPQVKFNGGNAFTAFQLAVWTGPNEAGQIEINCQGGLAPAAAKSVHQGDRLVVMGRLARNLDEEDQANGRNELELLALDLELVRDDSYFPW